MKMPSPSPFTSTSTALALVAVALLGAAGCATSSHSTQKSALGVPRSSQDLLAVLDTPGPVEVETVVVMDWAVDRSGLVNLDHPKAKAAGLVDGDEPMQVYFHVLRHPQKGVFLIDTGFDTLLRDHPDDAAIRGFVARFFHREKMKWRTTPGDWLATQKAPVAGVLLTHIHFDHIGGIPDLPAATPIYGGPGDSADRAFQNLFVQGSSDRLLEGKGPLNEWAFTPDASGRFEGVLDVFGDGSVWALWVPGHTPGATAYLVRTPNGPVLFTGDACHTRWGWDNGVEPGSFSSDKAGSAVSLEKLRKLAAEHPAMEVRLGHQR